MAALPAILDVSTIEQAVEARLVEQISAIRKTAIQKGGRYIFTNPSLALVIF